MPQAQTAARPASAWRGSRIHPRRKRIRLAAELASPFREEAVAAGFDAALHLLEERVAGQAGRDRIEELDHSGAGPTQEAAARPVEAGVQRYGQAGHGEVVVK